MEENDSLKFMRRCIDLALKAEGMTYPNPMVGAVIVHGGRIIGEGFHLKAGTSHAEVNAINSVADRELLKESVLYVNLEPCSHQGRTPPCADLIISCSIPEVVIGTQDTSSKVSGKGIARLRESGCRVSTGVLEEECRHLNRRFFTFHEKKRPYIILKWAESADHFMDVQRSEGGPGKWISGKPEKVLVHRWRATEQSILAGAGTVRADNPMLNVRDWKGNNPLRLVLSSSGRLDGDYRVFRGDRTVMFTHSGEPVIDGALTVLLDTDKPSCEQIAEFLASGEIQSVFVEGGSSVLSHFIENGLWDEALVFRGYEKFGSGVPAPHISIDASDTEVFRGSVLYRYIHNKMV